MLRSLVGAEMCIRDRYYWAPKGWEGDLPEQSVEAVENIVTGWLNLVVPEKGLPILCRKAILEGINNGFILGERWFKPEDHVEFIGELSGNDLERLAVEKLFDVKVARVNTRITKAGKHASVKLAEGYDAEETSLKLGAF